MSLHDHFMAHSITIKNSSQIGYMNEQDIYENPCICHYSAGTAGKGTDLFSAAAAVPENLKGRLLKAIDKAPQGSILWQKQRLRVNEAVSERFKIIEAPLTRSSSNALHHHRQGRISLLFIHTGEKGTTWD